MRGSGAGGSRVCQRLNAEGQGKAGLGVRDLLLFLSLLHCGHTSVLQAGWRGRGQ